MLVFKCQNNEVHSLTLETHIPYAILETHIPYARLSTFWSNNSYIPVHIIEANGHSGGIWLLRHSIVPITTNIIDSNQYSITFKVNFGDASSTCT